MNRRIFNSGLIALYDCQNTEDSHLIAHMPFPIGAPLKPNLYL